MLRRIIIYVRGAASHPNPSLLPPSSSTERERARFVMSLRRAVVMQSRGLLRSRRRTFSTTGATDQEQVGRPNIFKEIDELKAKAKREMIEDVEKVKRLENEDRNALNRLLTSCGMPRGAFRDELVFVCNVAAVFVASGAVGACSARWRDARRKRAKFGSKA